MGNNSSRPGHSLVAYVKKEADVVMDAELGSDYIYQTIHLNTLVPPIFSEFDKDHDTWLHAKELYNLLSTYITVLKTHGVEFWKSTVVVKVQEVLKMMKKSHPQHYDKVSAAWTADFEDMSKRLGITLDNLRKRLDNDPLWLRLVAVEKNELQLYQTEYDAKFAVKAIVVSPTNSGLSSANSKHQARLMRNINKKQTNTRFGNGLMSARGLNSGVFNSNARNSISPVGLKSPRGGPGNKLIFDFGLEDKKNNDPKNRNTSTTYGRRSSVAGTTPFITSAARRGSANNGARHSIDGGLGSRTGLRSGGLSTKTGLSSGARSTASDTLYAQQQVVVTKNAYSDMVSTQQGLFTKWLQLLHAGNSKHTVDYGQIDMKTSVSCTAFLETFRLVLEKTEMSFVRITRRLFNETLSGPIIGAFYRQTVLGEPNKSLRAMKEQFEEDKEKYFLAVSKAKDASNAANVRNDGQNASSNLEKGSLRKNEDSLTLLPLANTNNANSGLQSPLLVPLVPPPNKDDEDDDEFSFSTLSLAQRRKKKGKKGVDASLSKDSDYSDEDTANRTSVSSNESTLAHRASFSMTLPSPTVDPVESMHDGSAKTSFMDTVIEEDVDKDTLELDDNNPDDSEEDIGKSLFNVVSDEEEEELEDEDEDYDEQGIGNPNDDDYYAEERKQLEEERMKQASTKSPVNIQVSDSSEEDEDYEE